MDFPGSVVTPMHVHTYSDVSTSVLHCHQQILATTAASIAWPSANLASYVPINLPYPYSVKRVFWINGATAGGNVDFGIYTFGGARIYSTGSTAQSGTDVIQYVTPTNSFMLAPGRYYFALAASGTTGAVHGHVYSTYNEQARLQGFLQEASAVPLPATATFASAANACVAYCGVTRTSTGY